MPCVPSGLFYLRMRIPKDTTAVALTRVNAIIKEGHPLPGKVSHFPKKSALLERKVEQSRGKERCIQCHFEMKFAPGCWSRGKANEQQLATLMFHAIRLPGFCKRSQQHRNAAISAERQPSPKRRYATSPCRISRAGSKRMNGSAAGHQNNVGRRIECGWNCTN